MANNNDGGCYNFRSPAPNEDKIADISVEMRHKLVRQSKLLCGMSKLDCNFSIVRLSLIARAAVVVAMDIMCFPAW